MRRRTAQRATLPGGSVEMRPFAEEATDDQRERGGLAKVHVLPKSFEA